MTAAPSPTSLVRRRVHEVAVVIPVYRGETTLPGLLAEIKVLTTVQTTADGAHFRVTEVIPVWDNGPDQSAQVIHSLAATEELVHPIWLSRNYGQHAATMAGMAAAKAEWIVTLDEDGQHDPAAIGTLLDTALREQATVVYAKPSNPPPHGAFRNWASRRAKWFLSRVMHTGLAPDFNSFRLVLGETGRALAQFAGPGVYLDVALSWVARKVAVCPVRMRHEDRKSSYTFASLLAHFLRMIVTSGTRGLRLVTWTGLAAAVIGLVMTLFLVVQAFFTPVPVQGWTSLMCVLLVMTGLILMALGVVAEYLGVIVNRAMGRPLYLIGSDPETGPLVDSPVQSGPTP